MGKDRLPELLQRSLSTNSSNSSSNGSLLLNVYSGTTEFITSNSGGNNNSYSIVSQNSHSCSNNNSSSEPKDRSSSKMAQYGSNVDDILNPYTEIRQQLAQIAANLEAMNRMAQTVNLRTFNENEMDELHNKNLRLGNQLMTRFNDFKANLPAENDYSLEARMKRTLFYGLHQTFINLWHKNELFLQNYETKVKKNLRLHTKIINSEASEQEIELLIENKTTKLFVDNFLQETEKERQTLREMMDRFNELRRLEKSIEEVHALFMRIQTLVMEQSEVIQRVEFHAQQATLHVDKGADELDQAEQHQKKARKKKIMLIVILAAVLLVLLLVGIYL
ncbi:syntaxin-4 isoform X1 [Drosophila simulans]|uniref:Syx4 n=3 Tax=Drosophila simulans TaxID=7240 RepID=B4R3U5_DROSI|nr:syntaxin-4 isoform X1 [Drosophila simulans]EDX16957.1 Syx4 [Drosophila simulans]KMZ07973.1 Syx4, isoform A [Drosophila simulans]KMZ07975.1 Syx4, isoform C [Drosophila simulans]